MLIMVVMMKMMDGYYYGMFLQHVARSLSEQLGRRIRAPERSQQVKGCIAMRCCAVLCCVCVCVCHNLATVRDLDAEWVEPGSVLCRDNLMRKSAACTGTSVLLLAEWFRDRSSSLV